jgi:prephenate dehydrogenase
LRVAVIGAGKMGRWFTRLFKNEGFSVVVSSRTRSKAEALGAEFGVEVARSNVNSLEGADWILLCVSLDSLEPVLREIGSHVRPALSRRFL